jgi:hypothetical protein
LIQYGLRTAEGKWLPRDAYRRGMLQERMPAPDLWQDQERAIKYASQYGCTVVAFVVAEVLLHGVTLNDDVTCGAV